MSRRVEVSGGLFWELWAHEVDTLERSDGSPKSRVATAMRHTAEGPERSRYRLELDDEALAYLRDNALVNTEDILSSVFDPEQAPKAAAARRLMAKLHEEHAGVARSEHALS